MPVPHHRRRISRCSLLWWRYFIGYDNSIISHRVLSHRRFLSIPYSEIVIVARSHFHPTVVEMSCLRFHATGVQWLYEKARTPWIHLHSLNLTCAHLLRHTKRRKRAMLPFTLLPLSSLHVCVSLWDVKIHTTPLMTCVHICVCIRTRSCAPEN